MSQQPKETQQAGARPLAESCGRPLDPARFLELALAICIPLRELHRQNLNHNNLNPYTVLVAPEPLSVALAGSSLSPSLLYRYPDIDHPAEQEVMPAYMSPEQTGRLNLPIDQRSDLYALGVIFYQMLTGKLPFEARDLLEWVHCHIARLPQAPAELSPNLPRPLSDMVLKLLAKHPDDRYQSASGLQADLEKCLASWRAKGEIEPFTLAEEDLSERLLIPQRLYGRERETETLLAALDEVASGGASQIVMVAGCPGIGKSALVQELARPVNERRGFFARGKFDRLQGSIPYRTVAEAFRQLVRQILTMSEEEIGRWGSRIREAVGRNGELIVRVIPQVELVIGPQPAVPELPPVEAQNLFLLTFRRFVRVFAQPEHPLVLFLDDLQWADQATLRLIEYLFSDQAPSHLLFVGAYRDDEVGPEHPLARTLEHLQQREISVGKRPVYDGITLSKQELNPEIRNSEFGRFLNGAGAGSRISTITLSPLSIDDITRFLSDALHVEPQSSLPLAKLVAEMTGNNPFFVTQFLLSLYQEGLIELDRGGRCWRWDLRRIRERGYTENVVELMVAKLGKLPEATARELRGAACFGNRFDLDTFSVISGLPPGELRARLAEAVREGILESFNREYAFRHDRIQEAAYSMVPPDQRPRLHLEIGRVLQARLAEDAAPQRLFEVVDQLNLGASLIEESREKSALCRLNHLAGKRAKASIAYSCAFKYLQRAVVLLPPDCWTSCYRGTFDIFLDCAELAYLSGDHSRAAELFSEILAHAASDPDRVRVLHLQSKLAQVTGEFEQALRLMLEALQLVGITLPPPEEALGAPLAAELAVIREECARLPLSSPLRATGPADPRDTLIVTLLAESVRPAYATCPPYYSLCSAMAVSRCLRHGTGADCYVAYSTFAIVLIALFGEMDSALEFSEAAVAAVAKIADPRAKGLVLASHGGLVLPWRRHLAATIPVLEEGLSSLLEAGDFLDTAYLAPLAIWAVLEKGGTLAEVREAAQRYLSLNRVMHNETSYQTVRVIQQLVASLKGETREEGSFDDDSFSETLCRARFDRSSWQAGLAYFEVSKLLALFLFGRYREAVQAARRAEPMLQLMRAMPVAATLCFYQALAQSALYPALPPEEQAEMDNSLAEELEMLRGWAANCPENFRHRHALVAARVAALKGRMQEAELLYEQAIDSARAQGFLQVQALALELAAGFHRGRGFERFAADYLRRARALYLRWGARGKVRQLDREHPFLLQPEGGMAAGMETAIGGIDAIAVAKAMQAISQVMELATLQETLMRIVLEQSGAQKAVLLLALEERISAEVQVVLEHDGMAVARPEEDVWTLVPQTVVEYVKRTRESVILHDAREENMFSADRYLLEKVPVSLLCLPLLRQNHLHGLLYLENNLVRGAFTGERVAILEVLAGQAAISLENARLYSGMQQENRERKAAEENFRELMEAAPDAMVIVDDRGGIRIVNSQAEALFGYRREELYGQKVELLMPARFRERHPEYRSQFMADPKLRPMGEGLELFAQRKDGSEIPVGISLSPLRTPDGIVVIAAVRDISDRIKAEAELRESEQRYRQLSETLEQRIGQAVSELDQKNRLLVIQSRQAVMGEMISNIAHQWRQPLNTLGLLAQELLMTYRAGGFSPELMESNVKRTLEIIRHMSRTIDDFRYFFRPGREKEDFSARDALEKTLSLLEASLAAHHIAVEVECSGEPVINGYPNEFSQVLLNIISNARDAFVARAVAAPVIRMRLFSERGKVVVTVTDNAGGIPEEIIGKVFEPYFTTKGPEQGTGIGLYMCKSIIEKNMNGSISARNVEGGAEFRIEL